MNEPQEPTEEEVRNALLDHIWRMVDYWLEEPKMMDVREKLASLAFSILVALDGSSASIQGFLVAPRGDDEGCHREPDISGCLHDVWYSRDPRKVDTDSGDDDTGVGIPDTEPPVSP